MALEFGEVAVEETRHRRGHLVGVLLSPGVLGGRSGARASLGRVGEVFGGRKCYAGILKLLGTVIPWHYRLEVVAVDVEEEDVAAVVSSASSNLGHLARREGEEHDMDVVKISRDLLHG